MARNPELLTVTRRFDVGDSMLVTRRGSYHNLVSFLAERDDEWHKTLANASISPAFCDCRCKAQLKEHLNNKTKENLKRPYLQAEQVYLKALEDRGESQLVCDSFPGCSMARREIKVFIERMVQERETLCDHHMREKRYVQ